MKKALSLFLALVMCLSLAACGQGSSEQTEEQTEQALTLEELKAIIAINKVVYPYLNETLRNPESLSILGITVVDMPNEPDGYHMVKVEYNAENGMGGKNRDEMYVETNAGGASKNQNLEYLSDNDAERMWESGDNLKLYNESINAGGKEVDINIDTVLSNLDKTDDELFDLVQAILDEMEIE